MAKADKVIRALPIANMIKKLDGVQFLVLEENGNFAPMAGQRVIEFDKIGEANKMVSDLNSAIQSVLTKYRTDYEAKIEALLA